MGDEGAGRVEHAEAGQEDLDDDAAGEEPGGQGKDGPGGGAGGHG